MGIRWTKPTHIAGVERVDADVATLTWPHGGGHMSRSVLITGGLGFIGSHLAEDFHARGWHVTIVDDRRAAVVGWTPDPEMGVIESSVERVGFPPVDLIVHAASPVGPAGILGLAGDIVPQIIEPTRVVADNCARHKVPLIHISTSEVYNASGINSEDDDLIAPAEPSARGEYAVGKIAAEYIVRQRSRLDNFPALVIRPFNIAGARQPREKGFVIPTFVEQALAGEPMTVFGKGDQRRAFMSVADFCRLIATVSERPLPVPTQVINAGNAENATTINELAERVARRVGRYEAGAQFRERVSGNEVHGPEWREAAGYHKIPLTSAAARLGWMPEDDLDAIIDATAYELAGELVA
jgi:nucleoside-diphosphate-sugar epimerase